MNMIEEEVRHVLLICSIGGSPEPIIQSIRFWRPARVIFVPSSETKAQVQSIAVSADLRPGSWTIHEVSRPQEFGTCVQEMRDIEHDVERWSTITRDYDTIVDFTGGTKCMSAALALVARRWPCKFSYVGGTVRTREGVGVVISGNEQLITAENPLDSLGYQVIDEALLLFDQCSFGPAASILKTARLRIERESTKRTISTLVQLCEAYASWDRFDHRKAEDGLRLVLRNEVDISDALGRERSRRVVRVISESMGLLSQIRAWELSRAIVVDLLSNAKRRSREHRYDDAVARLYRAIEALGQLALSERHDIPSTDSVLLEKVPEPLRSRWSDRAEDGILRLALQDVYSLLDALGDDAGRKFVECGLDQPNRSALSTRNKSILAHGFQPVSAGVVSQLHNAAMKLGNFSESELLVFPTLVS